MSEEIATLTAPSKALPIFPTEIWFLIFKHFEYFDLKRCMRVNKSFKTIAYHSIFDAELYRGQLRSNLDLGSADDVLLHPIFDRLNHGYRIVNIAHVTLDIGEDNPRTLLLKDLPVRREHATSPALDAINIELQGGHILRITRTSGVTVIQIMTAICEFYSEIATRGIRLSETPWYDDYSHVTPGSEEERFAIIADLFGVHCTFVGFGFNSLTPKGELLLRLDHLDSPYRRSLR